MKGRRLLVLCLMGCFWLGGCGGDGGSEADTGTAGDVGQDGVSDDSLTDVSKPGDTAGDLSDAAGETLADSAGDAVWECTEASDCPSALGELAPCKKVMCSEHKCQVGNVPDGTPCDDLDGCTGDDQCTAGVCAGATDACVCGNGTCDADETCDSCSDDCGLCSCCTVHSSAGCDDSAVMGCVCQMDSYCCLTGWDSTCLAESIEWGCQQCEGFCENKVCEEDEDCLSCPQDCPCTECGDGECLANETCETCPVDCGICSACGDGVCHIQYEECSSCPADCGECLDSSCCQPHDAAGCGDQAVAACVGNIDLSCVLLAWKDHCVATARTQCNGCPAACGDGVCDENEGEECESCPFDCGACGACGDGVCASAYESCSGCPEDCGVCPTCGDGTCSGAGDGETCFSCPGDCGECTGSCCVVRETPGCQDVGAMDCVCSFFPDCCQAAWDVLCVQVLRDAGCLACPVTCGDMICDEGEDCLTCPSDCGECSARCCAGDPSEGCQSDAVRECVCAVDATCCSGAWDAHCADLITQSDCGECPGRCGNQACERWEDCLNCPSDCGECDLCKPELQASCCQKGNPCMLADNGGCDCGGACDWEVAECGVSVCGDGVCDPVENWQGCEEDCTASCEGYCEQQAPAGCFCDSACSEYGDCCSDIQVFCSTCGDGFCGQNEDYVSCAPDCPSGDPGSCAGKCGGKADSGCYCDFFCSTLGTCCSDKDAVCGYCGDGKCSAESGENALNCFQDC